MNNDPTTATNPLRDSNAFLGGAMLLVLLVNALDVIVPPLGIPTAVLVIWLYLRTTGRGWTNLGMGRPAHWPRTIALALVLAAALQAVAVFALLPLVARLTGEAIDLSTFDVLKGNVGMLALYLGVSWTTAGFGEEIIWRGFLLGGLLRLLGGGRFATVVGLFGTSAVFGAIHFYQGPTGILLTGFVGFCLGLIYLLNGRNLWLAILTHALMDTLAFLLLFFGVTIS